MIGLEESEFVKTDTEMKTSQVLRENLKRSTGNKVVGALGELQGYDNQCVQRPLKCRFAYPTTGRLFVIEGNIGVGKTTLATSLSRKFSCKVFVEPATENPYLQKFYQDPHKYALPLQLWILQQRYKTYIEATNHVLSTGNFAILDRSVFSDIVFANVCHKEGFITDEGYKKYQYWRSRAIEHLPLPHITVFLNATPVCCLERIKKRGRDCEGGVPLDYLEKLHKEYLLFCENMPKLGSLLLKYDWSSFSSSSMIMNNIREHIANSWSVKDMDNFVERHSSADELLSAYDLQSTLTEPQ